MALYSFRCDWHGSFDANGSMDAPPKWQHCPECNRWSQRVITVPQFNEDRTRFFRNGVDGTKHSHALGHEMPDSRRDYYRELESKGCEPCSPQTMPQAWKDNAAYKKHVESGGERDRKFELAQHPATQKRTVTVLDQLKKSGITI